MDLFILLIDFQPRLSKVDYSSANQVAIQGLLIVTGHSLASYYNFTEFTTCSFAVAGTQ